MIDCNEIDVILRDCLFDDEELVEGMPVAEVSEGDGLTHTFAFHAQRLESHRERVTEILRELPDSFMADGGGGMSFLNMPFDKNDVQWGEQRNAASLLALATALKLAAFPMPRVLWSALPGSVPYVTITLPLNTTTTH